MEVGGNVWMRGEAAFLKTALQRDFLLCWHHLQKGGGWANSERGSNVRVATRGQQPEGSSEAYYMVLPFRVTPGLLGAGI